MLTSSASVIETLVRPGGQLIVSGFDHTEVDAVLRAFAARSEEQRLTEDSWIALRLK
jgi:ribosomal protein L11 methylase PrmA